MAYEKAYELIGFVNGAPPSLGSTNLTKIDSAINTIDNRIIAVDEKATDAYDNSASALSGIAVIRDLYATKEEVTESIEELETEVAETYATKAELAEVSENVTEIATEVSEGKADVILANASGTLIHVEDSSESNSVEFKLIGADGSVEVKSLGKNIFNPAWLPTKTTNGVTLTNNGDNTWTFSGTQSGENFGFTKTFTRDTCPEQLKKAGTYTLSLVGLALDSTSQNFFVNTYYNGASHNGAIDSGVNKYSFTITEEMLAYGDFYVNNIGFWFKPGKSLKTGTIGIQIEYGETATEFEVYKESTTTINVDESTEAEVKLFYPVTNILNDEGCGMEVTYKADTRNYIDRIIGERISAIEMALINNV